MHACNIDGKSFWFKLAVVEEAIKYIDELHAALIDRFFSPTTLISSGDTIQIPKNGIRICRLRQGIHVF